MSKLTITNLSASLPLLEPSRSWSPKQNKRQVSQGFTQATRKATRMLSQIFPLKKPPTGIEFEVCPLPSASIPTQQENIEDFHQNRSDFLNQILEVFQIEKSELCRWYPPYSPDVRQKGLPRDKNYIERVAQLTNQLKEFGERDQTFVDSPFDNEVSQETGHPDFDKFSFVVKIIFPQLEYISFLSLGYMNAFDDNDILRVYQLPIEEQAGKADHYSFYTQTTKHLLFQLKEAISPAPSIAMLLLDAGIQKERYQKIQFSQSDADALSPTLEKIGFSLVKRRFSSLQALERNLKQNGSTVVVVYPFSKEPSRPHYVLVDAISKEGVTLRDPYHQWLIAVKNAAFEVKWEKSKDAFNLQRVEGPFRPKHLSIS